MAQCTSAGAHARTLQNMIDILQEEAVALESWAAGREFDRAALRLKAKLLIDLSNSGPAERELLELTAGLMLCGGNGFITLDERGRRRAATLASRLLNSARGE